MREWTEEEIVELKKEFLDTGIELSCSRKIDSEKGRLDYISINSENVDSNAIEKMLQKDIYKDSEYGIIIKVDNIEALKRNAEKMKKIFKQLKENGMENVKASLPIKSIENGDTLLISDVNNIDIIMKQVYDAKENENFGWRSKKEKDRNFAFSCKDIEIEQNGITVSNVTEFMNLEEIHSICEKNPNYIVYVNSDGRYNSYKIKDYEEIMNRLNYLVGDIRKELPEKERFARVYERVARSMSYDNAAAYPETEEEHRYANLNKMDSRNLKNGLIYGRCVCAGFAEILRNALCMLGIEAKYVSGECGYKTEEEMKREFKINQNGEYEDNKGEVWKASSSKAGLYYSETHAWNKVKIDGIWYNADACWDEQTLKTPNELPKYALLSDETMEKIGNRDCIVEPQCLVDANKYEIERLFSWDRNIRYVINEVVNNKRKPIDLYSELKKANVFISVDVLQKMMIGMTENQQKEFFENIDQQDQNTLSIILDFQQILNERLEENYPDIPLVNAEDVPFEALTKVYGKEKILQEMIYIVQNRHIRNEKMKGLTIEEYNEIIKPKLQVNIVRTAKEFGVTIDDMQNACNVLKREIVAEKESKMEER